MLSSAMTDSHHADASHVDEYLRVKTTGDGLYGDDHYPSALTAFKRAFKIVIENPQDKNLQQHRHTALIDLGETLLKNGVHVTTQDLEQLAKLAEDPLETNGIRIDGFYYLIFGLAQQGKRQVAANYCRAYFGLVDSIPKKKTKLTCYFQGKNATVADVIAENTEYISGLLKGLQNVAAVSSVDWLEDFFTNMNRKPAFPDLSLLPASVIDAYAPRLAAGGTECDWCHLTSSVLSCCSRCRRMYYCSEECQKHAWNSGHKRACRHRRTVKPGDMMEVRGSNKIKLVKICSEDVYKKGHWISFAHTNEAAHKHEVFAAADLRHIRPCK